MSLIDLPFLSTLSPALEKSINLALSVDPGAQAKLKPLDQCVLEIHLRSIDRSIFLKADDGKIRIIGKGYGAHVTLSGTSLAFIKLASQSDVNNLFKSKDLSMTGDAVRAQQIQNFTKSIDIDWEALLAEVIGDVPAHVLSAGVKQGVHWSRHLSQNFVRDVEEFIKYEVRLLPGKAIAASQFESIDQLRLATDRLEAKVRQLLKRTEQKTPD
ncbi:MAG: SCP2 sterol-binding domain-containing protein [Oleiphilaceae bacterium]|nr:SCP2 sterol-binding domain-containing protein [Oleiphilaceae bacterium]